MQLFSALSSCMEGYIEESEVRYCTSLTEPQTLIVPNACSQVYSIKSWTARCEVACKDENSRCIAFLG